VFGNHVPSFSFYLSQDVNTSDMWEDLFNRTSLAALTKSRWPIDLLYATTKHYVCSPLWNRYQHDVADTLFHQQQVSVLCVTLGLYMGLKEPQLKRLYMAALYHDVGKVLTKKPEVLFTSGTPSELEFEDVIKSHPVSSFDIIHKLFPGSLGHSIAEIAFYHHERPDGMGYPSKLKNKDICRESAVLRVGDGWDAMIRNRCYRQGIPPPEAMKILIEGKGTSYDCDVVDILTRLSAAVLLPVSYTPYHGGTFRPSSLHSFALPVRSSRFYGSGPNVS